MAKKLNPEKRTLALFYRGQTNTTYRQIGQKCKISKFAVFIQKRRGLCHKYLTWKAWMSKTIEQKNGKTIIKDIRKT